ncbi:MAG TPA: hypothetical protein VEZ90_01570 [Blastocatellia bacterium]|nr:hypothetical protein [Blastocatellia bacterium]
MLDKRIAKYNQRHLGKRHTVAMVFAALLLVAFGLLGSKLNLVFCWVGALLYLLVALHVVLIRRAEREMVKTALMLETSNTAPTPRVTSPQPGLNEQPSIAAETASEKATRLVPY